MKYTIGDRTFPTKKAALQAVQMILRNSAIDAPLTGNDYTLIRSLIDMHRGATQKLANGCKAIVVRLNHMEGLFSQRGFWIVGDNGQAIDFSIYVPFRSDEQNNKINQIWAARVAVQPVVQQCRSDYFAGATQVPCQKSGQMMQWDDAHVHHDGYWSFDRIHKEWIRQRNGVYPELIEQGELSVSLMTADDAAAFLKFHNERAILRVIHKTVHRSLGKAA